MSKLTVRRLRGAAAVIAIAIMLSGCSWFTPSHVNDVTAIVGCILAHDTEPPAQIAAVCGVEDEKEIADILAAHRTAMARHLACPLPSTSTSVTP